MMNLFIRLYRKGEQNVKQFNKIIIMTFIIGIFISNNYCQEKLAQTGFNFLEVSTDARSSGMAEAVNSISGYSDALFHNPASMAEITNFMTATFSFNKWIADINHLSASVILAPSSGDYGVVGFSLQSVDYGEVEWTEVADNDLGYIDMGIIKPIAICMGFGYAKSLSDKFSVGAQVKYAYQSLGSSRIPELERDSITGYKLKKNETDAIAVDFGTLYKTGIKSLAFGMSIRNYSSEVKYAEEGFQLPLLFTIGISADVFDFVDISGPEQSLLLSIDATHPRARAEQLKIGLEYKFMEVLALRGGYIAGNDEDDFTFGFGLTKYGFGVDYSYTPFGIFDNVQRFSARISL